MQAFEAEALLVCLGTTGNLSGWSKVNAIGEDWQDGQRCKGKQIMQD